jgi:hypothetical protein
VQPLLQWKSNKYYIFQVYVCSLRDSAYYAHAPYCHLWPIRLDNIFPHYRINGTVSKTNWLNIKCVFWFSLHLLSESFPILRWNERDMIINIYDLCVKYPLFLLDLHETWTFWTDFWKILRYQISWKSVQWEPSSVRTDGQTDMTKLIVAFAILRKHLTTDVFTNWRYSIKPVFKHPDKQGSLFFPTPLFNSFYVLF